MTTKKFYAWLMACSALLILSCGTKTATTDTSTEDSEEEAVEQVVEEGFTSLFDGKTLNGWRNYKSEGISDKWKVEDGTITLTDRGGMDIVTDGVYRNFELRLDWRISEKGNSGIFFLVSEADSIEKIFHPAPEMQILDNEGHSDAQYETHRAGDNYDMHSCSEETVKPAMEWNSIRLIHNNGHVEHWMNGTKVVEYEINSEDWKARYAKSKFSEWPNYGQLKEGNIGLQDHGDKVWFKNIRIKEL